jgi:replicative superfamily II helicase
MGVNMPAHLVIIKNTKVYRGDELGTVDLSRTTLIQMIGRAGRQGMSANGVAVLMTQRGNREHLQSLPQHPTPVKSALENNLKEILNTEVSE